MEGNLSYPEEDENFIGGVDELDPKDSADPDPYDEGYGEDGDS